MTAASQPGYIVGCQINIGIGNTSKIGGGVVHHRDPELHQRHPRCGNDTALELGPGQAGFVPIIQETDDDDDNVQLVQLRG